jgi:hypothetical protein
MAEAALKSQDVSKTTVANTSTLLFTAGKFKRAWRAMAPRNADIWINPTGGVCGPDLPGCFYVPAGVTFGSQPDIVESDAPTYWCSTAGLIIPVVIWF